MMWRTPSLARLVWRRRLRAVAATMLLGGLVLAAWFWQPAPAATVLPIHVIDGDSLTVRREGARLAIRLTGIDAVEYRQPCERAGTLWPCGRAARSALERLVGRKPLHCALMAKDRYGRTLATCRTARDPDGVDLGSEMVRQGWAVASDDAYLAEEVGAAAGRRGIWQGRFIRPGDWRAAHERPSAAATLPDA